MWDRWKRDGREQEGSAPHTPATKSTRSSTSRLQGGNLQVALYLTYKLLNQDSFRLPSLLLHFNLSVYFSPLSFHSLLTDLIYHLQILSPIIASAIPSMLNFLYLNILSFFSPFDKRSLVNLEFWIPSLLLSFLREAIHPRVQPICR